VIRYKRIPRQAGPSLRKDAGDRLINLSAMLLFHARAAPLAT
jgi:hypothetical protein